MRYFVTIKYIDGTSECVCADEVENRGTCLMLYKRFGVDSGERYIPFDRIKEWKVER